MMDKSSNTEPFNGEVNANLVMLGENPDYVRAMVKITNCIVQGRFHEGVYYPVEGPESASESESEEELPPTMLPASTSSSSSTPPQQQLQQQQQQQQQLQLQDTALQFHSVAFKAQQYKQHMQQLQQQLMQQQQQHQKEQSTPAICNTALEQPPNSIVSKKLKRSETVQDFAEKYWRETQKLNRVFEDEDCFLVSNHKSSKNLSNLGRVLHTTPRRHHSRSEHKTQSDEPKGIALYLQPINHDLTFKTNSTVDKSTQI